MRLKSAELAAYRPPSLQRVGGWKIDRRSKQFVFERFDYGVAFELCDSPLKLLDWILHLHGKTWGRESIGDFIAAVRNVFGESIHPGCQS